LKELQLPSIASLRAIAALKSPHLALVRPARIGLGFESAGASQKSLAEVEQLLGGKGRLSLPYSLRWLLDAMAGLGVLHRTLGFVHGEVQPESVVLGEDGVGRLVPVVRAHWVRGEERPPETLYYLAPEKLLGDNVDVRADVFSIGVMLWEALSGQRLIEAYTIDDIIARLMGGGIPRANQPEGESWTAPLGAIAERALTVDPGRRFGSVGEMKASIESVCQRYLASPPGMAELFRNPQLRARSYIRDSLPPESQRVTVPPDPPPPRQEPSSPREAELDAAAERLSRSSFLPPDPEEETVTKVNAAPAPLVRQESVTHVHVHVEPVPVVRPARHVNTLLGVPMPAIERREPASGPESVTTPFARPIPSTPPPVVIPTISPAASEPPLAPLPFGKTRTQFNEEPTRPEERARAPHAAAAVAPAKAAAAPMAVQEPSFELTRPRKRRGALWLVLGAAAAVALFAARPWLARQLSTSTAHSEPEARDTNESTRNAAALVATVPSATSTSPSSASTPVGIASTSATPSERPATARRPGTREEHAVIHDRVEPEPVPAAPIAPTPPPKPEPAAEPPPAPPPPPAPKPKQVPVSDADRYGI
jgi:hypothetical protein